MSGNRKSQGDSIRGQYRLRVVFAASLVIIFLFLLASLPREPAENRVAEKTIPTPLVAGYVRLSVVRPVMFVSPTPFRETTTNNYAYINVTTNATAEWAYLEWNAGTNATNLTMSGAGTNFHINMTGLANANYTFMVYANISGIVYTSLFNWVNVSYTKAAAPPPAPPAAAPPTGPQVPPLPPIWRNATIDQTSTDPDATFRLTGYLLKGIFNFTIEIEPVSCENQTHFLRRDERFYMCFLVKTRPPVPDENIYDAAVVFRVKKSWIVRNNVNTTSIHMARDKGGRQNLPTWPVNTDDGYVYYVAKTPGLSVFMIIGQVLPEPVPEIEIPMLYCGDGYCDYSIGEGCTNCLQDCACGPGSTCVRNVCFPECEAFGIRGKYLGLCWWWWIIAVLVIIIGVLEYKLYKSRRGLKIELNRWIFWIALGALTVVSIFPWIAKRKKSRLLTMREFLKEKLEKNA